MLLSEVRTETECEPTVLSDTDDVLSLSSLQTLNIDDQLSPEFMNINDGVWTEEEAR